MVPSNQFLPWMPQNRSHRKTHSRMQRFSRGLQRIFVPFSPVPSVDYRLRVVGSCHNANRLFTPRSVFCREEWHTQLSLRSLCCWEGSGIGIRSIACIGICVESVCLAPWMAVCLNTFVRYLVSPERALGTAAEQMWCATVVLCVRV